MRITPHVYNMHIDDGAISHPGGSNNYFVGDPNVEMVLIDTGDHWREWTQAILDYYDQLGRPNISAILITHGHVDHIGGLDRMHEAMGAPVRCHPKLVDKLRKALGGDDAVEPLESDELVRVAGVELQALFTPGHEVDHVCYYLEQDGVMFTGDTVLGGSSTSVGDLSAYMESLELIMSFEHTTVCPRAWARRLAAQGGEPRPLAIRPPHAPRAAGAGRSPGRTHNGRGHYHRDIPARPQGRSAPLRATQRDHASGETQQGGRRR